MSTGYYTCKTAAACCVLCNANVNVNGIAQTACLWLQGVVLYAIHDCALRISPVTSFTGVNCLWLQVESEFKVQGLEVRAPEIFPPNMGQGEVQEGATAVARHAACVSQDPATHPRSEVHARSLMKALAAASLTQSELLLLSTGDAQRSVVHVLCAFVGSEGVLADYAFNVWLPGRDPEDV